VFSCFLPNVSLERTSSWAKDNDDRSFSYDDSAILIKRGVLIHGQRCRCYGAALSLRCHVHIVHCTWMLVSCWTRRSCSYMVSASDVAAACASKCIC
jgi:hypothetical protein